MYTGNYSIFETPFYASWGGIFIPCVLPIPKTLQNAFDYTITNITLQGELQTIAINYVSPDRVMIDGGTIMLTNSMNVYFNQTGARYNTLLALNEDNACIGINISVTKK